MLCVTIFSCKYPAVNRTRIVASSKMHDVTEMMSQFKTGSQTHPFLSFFKENPSGQG